MRRPVLLTLILLAQGCSGSAPPRGETLVRPRSRPVFAEEQLRLEGTAVRVWKDGSKVTFALSNRTPADLCIARHEWVGESHEATRVYDADGKEFAYRGVLTEVGDQVRLPVRVPAGETLRQEEDLAASYQVKDWATAKVVYSPAVSLCPTP